MKQRVPNRSWFSRHGSAARPRVLVEDDHPALAISDFSLFREAGLDVAFCSGPGRAAEDCPLLRGEACGLLAGADIVLHGLDPGLGIAAAIRRRHPDMPVVVGQRRGADGPEPVPEGCVPLAFPCSVRGQVAAVRAALTGPRPVRAAGAQGVGYRG